MGFETGEVDVLSRRIQALGAEIRAKDAEIRSLKEQIADDGPIISRLNSRLAEVEAERDTLFGMTEAAQRTTASERARIEAALLDWYRGDTGEESFEVAIRRVCWGG